MNVSTSSKLSELIISINVLGDIHYTINKFNPKMIYSSSIENRILFIPNIPITMNSLIKSNVTVNKDKYRPSDFINVFSNPTLLNKVIQFIKTKNIKNVSTQEAEQKNYIKNNINLILSIYFDNDNKLTINNRRYPIHSYKWDQMYTINKSLDKKNENYNVNVEVYVLDEKKSGNINERISLTCDMKRRNIALDLKELGFDVNIPTVGTENLLYNVPSIRNPSIIQNRQLSYNRYNPSRQLYNRPYNRQYNRPYNRSYNRPYNRSYTRNVRGGKYNNRNKYKKTKKHSNKKNKSRKYKI